MQIQDKAKFISLLPKNMEEEIKETIFQIREDIKFFYSMRLASIMKFKDLLKEIQDYNIIRVHKGCFLFEYRLKRELPQIYSEVKMHNICSIFKHLLDQQLSQIIVISVLSSLFYFQSDGLFSMIYENYSIHNSLFQIIKKTQTFEVQYQSLQTISAIHYDYDDGSSIQCLLIENGSLNYLIRWINEDKDDNLSLTLSIIKIFKFSQSLLREKLRCLIPPIVRKLISKKYEIHRNETCKCLEILKKIKKSEDEIMNMNKQEIIKFADLIILLALENQVDIYVQGKFQEIICKMLQNKDLAIIILEKGLLDKYFLLRQSESDFDCDCVPMLRNRIIQIFDIFDNIVVAEFFIASNGFKRLISKWYSFKGYFAEDISRVIQKLLSHNTKTINQALFASKMHLILSSWIFKDCQYLLQSLSLNCLTQLHLNRRILAENLEEYLDEKYSYYRSQRLKDLIEKAINFQFIHQNMFEYQMELMEFE